MATAGEEFGDERTPILQKTDDQDDGDAGPGGDQTTEFEPGASSTPAPNGNQRKTTLNRPGEQPSFVELPDPPGLSTTTFAEIELIKEFPNFDKKNIKYMFDEKSGRLLVGNSQPGKPYYPLITKISGKDEYRINPKLPKNDVLRYLGKGRRVTLEEEIKRLTDGINDNKAVAEDSSVSEAERNNARERAKRQIDKRTDMTKQLDQLKKGNYSLPSESIELEDFQKNDEVRQEREQVIQSEDEKQDAIINDKNSSPAEIESAKQRKNEIEQERNEIENEREREMEQLSLGDRLREKVKAIFKKYGFTVGSVFLAVGTTLGVVLSSLSNGLKGVSRGVGNGLKTLGKKIAQILPGLIGAVVSFVFRTAGNVVGFLGKHAWLLILAVAAFLFERVMKRRG